RTQASNLVGYAWHGMPKDFMHPVLDAFVHSITNAAEERGYHLLTFTANRDGGHSDVYQELFSRNQVAGFILADTVTNDARVKALIERQIPFVTFGQANDEWDFCWVDVDGYYGMKITIEHLLERGHRRIAFITWPEGSQSGTLREKGYREALTAAGITPCPEWIVRGENSAELGQYAVRRLLALPAEKQPTALACVSDLIAIGALNALQAAGLVAGEDVALTGFDNIPLVQYTQPPLTSVHQPINRIGETVIELLLRQINDEPVEQKNVVLLPELIVRASS